jgi:hypothetical protein
MTIICHFYLLSLKKSAPNMYLVTDLSYTLAVTLEQ